ncbi:hypothetical protein IWW47_004227 [Coemansia sp. RSA 2052]|nr:hypothetical protein IWW47_004227 [Coemansia sp. RSA 2052]
MARNLSKPWLREIIGDSGTVLCADLKDVGRVQVFSFAIGSNNLSCEISDSEDFIVAAFTKKAVSAFEQKHGRSLPSATGAVVHIKACSLRLHLPHPPSSQSFCPAPDNGMCPRSICALSRPQFWVLISAFAYVGGDGNSVFGQPHNVNFRDMVSFKLERLDAATAPPAAIATPTSAKRVASAAAAIVADTESLPPVGSPEKQTRKRQKSCSADAALSPRLNAPHMSRRTSARVIALPALGDVPFIDDMKSAWECQSLWSTLAIQQASVPLMPIRGLASPRPRPNIPQPQPPRQEQEQERLPPHTAARHISQILARPAMPPPQPPIQSDNGDTLNGLLVPEANRTTPAFAMMDFLYGDSCIFDKNRMDTDDEDEGEEEDEIDILALNPGAVIARSSYWDQPAPFAFNRSQFN